VGVEAATGRLLWSYYRIANRTARRGFTDCGGTNGVMVLVETTPAEYRQRGSSTIPDVKRERPDTSALHARQPTPRKCRVFMRT